MIENISAIRRGLAEMEKQHYSLVFFRGRWSFTVNNEPPDNPTNEFALVTSGQVLRSGHWASPVDALASIGGR